ncbi:MAG: hypothetical protein M1812_000631 [Candelaria pacifica]|nr:MAG: hypothetical protein M1812_000631 [Candelaria pacifica]
MRPSLLSPLRQCSINLPRATQCTPCKPTTFPFLKPTQQRYFISSSFQPEPQSLTATRTLSFPASALYTVIADIDAYSSFLPFLTTSKVTQWSNTDAKIGKKWPQEAELRVGYGGYEEAFQSKVYCVPGSIVEAIAGQAKPTIEKEKLEHHTGGETSEAVLDLYMGHFTNKSSSQPIAAENPIFTSLLTRWNLRTFPYKPPPSSAAPGASHDPASDTAGEAQPQESRSLKNPKEATEQTEVSLVIEYQFASPMYAALSKAFAPKVAGLMIEAFEKRALDVLGEGGDGPGISNRGEKQKSALEGVMGGKNVGDKDKAL